MKKTIKIFTLVLISIFLMQGQSYAISLKENMNMPMWINKDASRTAISIKNNTAYCSAYLRGQSGTTKVSATMSLQKKSGSSWTTVKTWSSSNSGSSLSFSRSASVSKGNTYRLQVKATTVTNGRSETSTMYSNQVAY